MSLLRVRKARRYARRSGQKGTGLFRAICKSVPVDTRSGTFGAMSCLCSMATASLSLLIHTHTQVGRWDLIIAHPPCTDLAVSGARHFAQKQKDGRQQKSIVLFMQMALADCPKICVENPVGIMSSAWKKPTQIIQPCDFGDPHRKTTCLWLKGLPPLFPTEIVNPTLKSYTCKNGKNVTFDVMYCETVPGVPRAKARSKTFPGIAKAMAEQWG